MKPTPRKPWRDSSTAGQRLRGRALQRLRKTVLAEQPLCPCTRPGRAVLAVEVDHITPLSLGGTYERSNLQGLCEACHAAKTARETGRRAPAPRYSNEVDPKTGFPRDPRHPFNRG